MEREQATQGFEALLAAGGVGADTLHAGEREALDELGFVVLTGVVAADRLAKLRGAFDAAAHEHGEQRGTRHFDAPAWHEPAFDVVYDQARILAAVWHVLERPFRYLVCGGRNPLPGFGAQGLHTDWLARAAGEPYAVASALWLLDDFTADNGSTRVVAGSHRVPAVLPRSMQQPRARHPGEQRVIAPAGSVLVFNGHLLHGGARNDSDGPRRAVHCQFVACDRIRPQDELPALPALPERLTHLARLLLGGADA